MDKDWETFFTIGWFALWFLFPIGIFLSVGRLDKNSDELERIKSLRVDPPVKAARKQRATPKFSRLVARH